MTQNHIVSAVFDSQSEAERAVRELREAGVSDGALSVVGRHDGTTHVSDGSGHTTEHKDGTGGLVKGLIGGGVVGGLLGVAALAIPGVGPLAAAGAIAASAVPEGAAIGAAVGATAGGLSGFLKNHGVSHEDASYYESRINDGGIFVSVDTRETPITGEAASEILYRAGGHSASRSKMANAL